MTTSDAALMPGRSGRSVNFTTPDGGARAIHRNPALLRNRQQVMTPSSSRPAPGLELDGVGKLISRWPAPKRPSRARASCRDTNADAAAAVDPVPARAALSDGDSRAQSMRGRSAGSSGNCFARNAILVRHGRLASRLVYRTAIRRAALRRNASERWTAPSLCPRASQRCSVLVSSTPAYAQQRLGRRLNETYSIVFPNPELRRAPAPRSAAARRTAAAEVARSVSARRGAFSPHFVPA
jgi:hypothetical protein